MGLTAVRGALGFLTRLPIGHDERSWEAFRRSPVTFPLVGYAIGGLVSLPVLLPIPAEAMALLFVAWTYLVTGITHADGLADLADALVVHGTPSERRTVLKDTSVGVGALLSITILVLGVGLAGLALGSLPWTAIGLVVAAEVGAKVGMAAIACFGSATHEGLGSQLTDASGARSFVLPVLATVPAVGATWPHPAAAVGLAMGVIGSIAVFATARRRLGGVNGDVFGASNEVARLAALHAGVIAWTLW